jgi:hypothetical protein
MIHGQNCKSALVIYPRALTTNADVTGQVDTIGYKSAMFQWHFGVQGATTAYTTIKLAGGSTSTAWTDIVAFTGGTATSTSAGFVIPSGVTADGHTIRMSVNLNAQERYIKAFVRGADTASVIGCCVATLYRGETVADTTTEMGVTTLVIG